MALVLLGLSTAAIAPVMVTQMRQATAIESRLAPGVTHYVAQSQIPWFAKLGGRAALTASPFVSSPLKVSGSPPNPIVDDLEPHYYEGGSWGSQSRKQAYNDDSRRANAGDGSSICLWEFTNLRAQNYVIQASWPVETNAATNAPYGIYDAASFRGRVYVNQNKSPVGETANGVTWQTLGIYWIDTGAIWVTLDNNSNGRVSADAIRIVPAALDLNLTQVDLSPETQQVSVHMTVTPIQP
ncbi:MAG: hypothetical protein O3A00_17645 [Planctomycetota bacterium]|nr:hypothetical protein [Planctomycetota bacterium]